jgi:hypothetical protein
LLQGWAAKGNDIHDRLPFACEPTLYKRLDSIESVMNFW